MKYTHPKLVGAGGIHCPCCRKRMTLKELRTKLSRVERRKVEQELQQLALHYGEDKPETEQEYMHSHFEEIELQRIDDLVQETLNQRKTQTYVRN